MNFLVKNGIDIGASLVLTETFNVDFWEELLIAFAIVLLNSIIFPLIKKIGSKLGANPDKVEQSMNELEDTIKNIDKDKEK